MEIRNELGPFHFTTVDRDGKERVKRPIIMLENGAKYEGEWYAHYYFNFASF